MGGGSPWAWTLSVFPRRHSTGAARGQTRGQVSAHRGLVSRKGLVGGSAGSGRGRVRAGLSLPAVCSSWALPGARPGAGARETQRKATENSPQRGPGPPNLSAGRVPGRPQETALLGSR